MFANVFGMQIIHLFRGKKAKNEGARVVKLLKSTVWHGISSVKCPCSVAQFTHPSFGSVQLLSGNICELTWKIWTLSTTTLHKFQIKYLGKSLLKPVSATQAPMLPATSPFGPCAAAFAAQPHHEPGWQRGGNWFSASFPHWRPSSFAGMLHGRAQGSNPGALQPCYQIWNPRQKNKTYITYRARKALADKIQEIHIHDFHVYYRLWYNLGLRWNTTCNLLKNNSYG